MFSIIIEHFWLGYQLSETKILWKKSQINSVIGVQFHKPKFENSKLASKISTHLHSRKVLKILQDFSTFPKVNDNAIEYKSHTQ
jgi:hypothetical protein